MSGGLLRHHTYMDIRRPQGLKLCRLIHNFCRPSCIRDVPLQCAVVLAIIDRLVSVAREELGHFGPYHGGWKRWYPKTVF